MGTVPTPTAGAREVIRYTGTMAISLTVFLRPIPGTLENGCSGDGGGECQCKSHLFRLVPQSIPRLGVVQV